MALDTILGTYVLKMSETYSWTVLFLFRMDKNLFYKSILSNDVHVVPIIELSDYMYRERLLL